MGWTYTRRPKGESHQIFFARRFDGQHHKVLATSGHLDVVYAALQVIRDGQEPFVIGMVILTHWDHDSPFNFGYQDMTEEMGQCAATCPRRILDLLTPLDELERRGITSGSSLEFATAWRQRCEENLAKRATLRLSRGMVLRTPNPIKFKGRGPEFEADTFVIANPRRLHASLLSPDGFPYSTVRFTSRDRLLDAEHIADLWPREV